jgi:hypothetical protein
MPNPETPIVWGYLAEYADARDLRQAVARARAQGYRELQVYSPVALPELAAPLNLDEHWVTIGALIIALLSAIGAYAMQWYASMRGYPFLVGGKPYASWAPFLVVSFAMAMLGAVLGALLIMFARNRMPRPYHPVFNVPDFARASRDRFFLAICAHDPLFDHHRTPLDLRQSGAVWVHEVPP